MCTAMLHQNSNVLYRARTGINATEVRRDLFTSLALDAALCPTVTRNLRDALFGCEHSRVQEPAIPLSS
jgi:hypothetical protein